MSLWLIKDPLGSPGYSWTPEDDPREVLHILGTIGPPVTSLHRAAYVLFFANANQRRVDPSYSGASPTGGRGGQDPHTFENRGGRPPEKFGYFSTFFS